jgi:senataxin
LDEIKNVGVISFYESQAMILREKLVHYVHDYGLTIKTIDSYQGSEKDYIILTTVRCNLEGKNGFCKE